MWKNSWLFLFVIAACSPQKPELVVSAAWMGERVGFTKNRGPANTQNPSCRKELFTVEEVRREAKHYEAQLDSDRKIRGKWKHIELNSLPVPQAKFLQAIGDQYGDVNNPEAHDVSRCEDGVCVVNAVYKSTDQLEGWMTYLWYLKMGNLLTFKNKVHSQSSALGGKYNGKDYELKDYLYSRDELYAFWRMSHALSTPFKSLPRLKEIQRVPRTSAIEGRGGMVCGVAFSNGFILLNDACLSLRGNDKDLGFMYEGTTHEMGHHVDWEIGRQSPGGMYYSEKGIWREKGGWSIKEYLDEETNTNVRQWENSFPATSFVRSYAQTSPAEHFADTIAFYRYEGNMTKRKIPEPVYEILRKDFYEEAEYTSTGLIDQFEKDIVHLMTADLFQAAFDCEENPGEITGVSPIAADAFPFSVSIATRRCLSQKLKDFVDQSIVEAKLNHVDGCRVLNANTEAQNYRKQIEGRFTQEFVRHIVAARENLDYYKNLNEFYQILAKRAVPMQIMTACYGEENEKECYGLAVEALIDEVLPSSSIQSDTMIEDLKKRFYASYGFEQVRAENIKLHQDFIFSQSGIITDAVEEIWNRCSQVPLGAREALITGHFSVGEGWMEVGQFNCINREIPQAINLSLSEMSFAGLGVRDPQESKILFDLTIPYFQRELARLYGDSVAIESERVVDYVKNVIPKMIADMSKNFSWVNEGQSFRTSCEESVLGALKSPLRYHDQKVAIQAPVSEACAGITSSNEFKDWIKNHSVYAQEILREAFISEITNLGYKAADECIKKNTSDNVISQLLQNRSRRSCFTWEWRGVQSTAWRESLRKTEISSITQAEMKRLTDAEVERIRLRIIAEKF
jgi:hypothetical protein